MTTAPIAYTVHPGGQPVTDELRQTLARWLPANGINPGLVSSADPIHVLPLPFRSSGGEGPWLMQVIVFHQMYEGPTGAADTNLITGQTVKFQRTVPLTVPFPATPTTADEGTAHGQAEGEAAQEAPEELVRDQEQEGVPDPRQGARQGGPVEGGPTRHEGAAEEGPGRGDEEVPEPEEERQEEVGAR